MDSQVERQPNRRKTGFSTKGKLADIIVVEGNPLENIRNTDNVRMVFKDGVRYL